MVQLLYYFHLFPLLSYVNLRTFELKFISFQGQIIVTHDFKTKKNFTFIHKICLILHLKLHNPSLLTYYYVRYYPRSSTFCGWLLDSGPSNMRHAMKTFFVHCQHYIIATSLIYYINGHGFKFTTGHKKCLLMRFPQRSIPESFVKKKFKIDKVIQLLLKPCTFYTLKEQSLSTNVE